MPSIMFFGTEELRLAIPSVRGRQEQVQKNDSRRTRNLGGNMGGRAGVGLRLFRASCRQS